MKIGGGPPLFMHGLKGGPFCQQKCQKLHLDAINKFSLLKQLYTTTFIDTYKSVSYNIDLISSVNLTSTIIIIVVVLIFNHHHHCETQ